MVCTAPYNHIKWHETMQTCKTDEGYNSATISYVVFSSSSIKLDDCRKGLGTSMQLFSAYVKFLAWPFFFFFLFSQWLFCFILSTNKWVYSSSSSGLYRACNQLATNREKPCRYWKLLATSQVSRMFLSICINCAASLASPTRSRTSFCNCWPTV